MPCLLDLSSLDVRTLWCRLACRNLAKLNFVKTGLKIQIWGKPTIFFSWARSAHNKIHTFSSFDAPSRDICGWSMQTLGSKGNSEYYGSKHLHDLHKENLSTQLDSTPTSSVNGSKEVEALYKSIHMILSWKCGVCGIAPSLKVIAPSNHHFTCPSLYRPCYLAACTGVSLIWQTFYIMKKPQDMSLHI